MFTRIPTRLRRPSLGTAIGVIVLVLAAPGGAVAAPSQDACSPAKEIVDAMVSQFGLTQQQARDRIRAECRAPGVLEAARQAAGEAYGGAFFDPGSKALIVGVTDPAVFDAVRATGAEPRLVAAAYAELEQDLHVLDSRTNTQPPEVTGWRVDDTANSVIVDVAGGPSQAVKTFVAGLDHTLVHFNQPPVQTTAELIGGMGIFGPANRCSLGFSSRKASGGADVYVLTAGHCTNFGGDWSGGFGGGMIGGVADSSFPINDYGLIVRMNTTWVATSKIQGGSSVLGNTVAPVGATVCRSGATTGFRCGRVIALNQTVSYGSQETVFQLTRTNVCSETGDSGGPFVSSTRQAQGVTSGGSGNCSTGGTTYYQPVNEILTFFGLTLVTG